MLGEKVHEALYQNYEICSPGLGGSGPRVGPIWPCSENVLIKIFKNLSYPEFPYIYLRNTINANCPR